MYQTVIATTAMLFSCWQLNTFQLVLASNENKTYTIYNYDQLQWFSSLGENASAGVFAFDDQQSSCWHHLTGSQTAKVKWLFVITLFNKFLLFEKHRKQAHDLKRFVRFAFFINAVIKFTKVKVENVSVRSKIPDTWNKFLLFVSYCSGDAVSCSHSVKKFYSFPKFVLWWPVTRAFTFERKRPIFSITFSSLTLDCWSRYSPNSGVGGGGAGSASAAPTVLI